jgi:hypothetical protein
MLKCNTQTTKERFRKTLFRFDKQKKVAHMKLSEFLFKSYGCNEPIYVDEVEYDGYSRSWIFNEFKKFVDSGLMRRFDKGIYYFPSDQESDAGIDPAKIIHKRFIASGTDIYGYISGQSLLYDLSLSRERPAILELVTNNESSNMRVISVGPEKIRARRSRTIVTQWNVKILQYLDLIKELDPDLEKLTDAHKKILGEYVMELTINRESIIEYGRFFSSRVARKSLDFFVAYTTEKYPTKTKPSTVDDYFADKERIYSDQAAV